MNSPLPQREGIPGHARDTVPALRQGSFTLPAPVRPNKPEYIPLPPEPDEHAGRGFLGGWFESDAARQERQNENLRRWQTSVADIERENALLKQRYEKQRIARAEQYAEWQHQYQSMKKSHGVCSFSERAIPL